MTEVTKVTTFQPSLGQEDDPTPRSSRTPVGVRTASPSSPQSPGPTGSLPAALSARPNGVCDPVVIEEILALMVDAIWRDVTGRDGDYGHVLTGNEP